MEPDKRRNKTLVVTGGGTGGHILAGIAIADAWKACLGDGAKVEFVGARGRLEERLVPQAGYPLHLLDLGSLNRVSLWRKLKTLFQLPIAFIKSYLLIIRLQPHAVIGVGGYASGPFMLATKLWSPVLGIRMGVLEQNAVPGMTNRILGKWVDWVFTAFPTKKGAFLPEKILLTGNPIRNSMQPMPSVGATEKPFVIFAFGGSQGAMGMNSLILEALPQLKGESIEWIHQTGEKDYERVLEAYQKSGAPARVEKFIDDMAGCYRRSNLLICRAGSGTLSEIAAVQRTAILVPLPTAADNHQLKNAEVYQSAGAAEVVQQGESNGEDLAAQIRKLIGSPERIRKMEEKISEFYRPNAAQDIVKTLLL